MLNYRGNNDKRCDWEEWDIWLRSHADRIVDRKKPCGHRSREWRAQQHRGVGSILLLRLSSWHVDWPNDEGWRYIDLSERRCWDHELGSALHRHWSHRKAMRERSAQNPRDYSQQQHTKKFLLSFFPCSQPSQLFDFPYALFSDFCYSFFFLGFFHLSFHFFILWFCLKFLFSLTSISN